MINKIMEKELTRTEFIKTSGLALLLLFFIPSLVSWVFKEKESLRTEGNKVLLNDEVIMEIQ